MKELFSEVLKDLRSNQDFTFIDDKGKQISLQEASQKGISIKPVNTKENALKKLSDKGIDLHDKSFVSDLMELINLVGATPAKSSIGNNKIDKKGLVAEYEKVQDSMSMREFARKENLNYQTFTRWVKKFGNS